MTEPLAGSLACAKFQACRKPCNLAIELGIAKDRIETIIDFAAAGKHHVKTDGSAAAADRQTVAYLANLIAWGEIVMPIAAIYPFDAIREPSDGVGIDLPGG